MDWRCACIRHCAQLVMRCPPRFGHALTARTTCWDSVSQSPAFSPRHTSRLGARRCHVSRSRTHDALRNTEPMCIKQGSPVCTVARRRSACVNDCSSPLPDCLRSSKLHWDPCLHRIGMSTPCAQNCASRTRALAPETHTARCSNNTRPRGCLMQPRWW